MYSVFIGIGRTTAKMLVKCGAEVIALSRTQADLDTLKTEARAIFSFYLNGHGFHSANPESIFDPSSTTKHTEAQK